MNPSAMPPTTDALAVLASRPEIAVRAMLMGERIDVRGFSADGKLGTHPLVISVGTESLAVLFRFGAAVLFNASRDNEAALLREVGPSVAQPYSTPETEAVTLRIDAGREEGIEEGVLYLRQLSVERVQAAAWVLAKSVVLAEYEARVAADFDRVEPFAAELSQRGRGSRSMQLLLKQIGAGLLTEHRMVARAEIRDKPDLLWEQPSLEPLYLRLEREYEIKERYATLELKLALNARTLGTVLELLQYRRTLRVEWYIVALIVAELALSLGAAFGRW
jgi:uncharacterized Rmd1/YagE family protein